jgi:predicted DNA-binding transcriptional regulator AlpA
MNTEVKPPLDLPALCKQKEHQRQQERRNARPTGTAQYLGISLASLWRWHADRPDFPRARKIGPRATVWDLNEIDAWLDAQQQS